MDSTSVNEATQEYDCKVYNSVVYSKHNVVLMFVLFSLLLFRSNACPRLERISKEIMLDI